MNFNEKALLTESLKKLILTYLTVNELNIVWMSKLTGFSVRTLQRRIAKEGADFKTLVSEARSTRATWLLTQSALPVEEIAQFCGYSDVSNFNRAFRKWFGCTPAHFRRQGNHESYV
jgi:AraC-like DNA-binding protein